MSNLVKWDPFAELSALQKQFFGDEEICEDCVNTECFYCERCEEQHVTTDRVYLEEEDIYVCRRCADEE